MVLLTILLCLLFTSSNGVLIPTNKAQITAAMTIEDFVSLQLKMPFERHFVTTADGYILETHRLKQPKIKNAPVLIMQHGILASSWCFLISEDLAPAVKFWEQGYDIWLTNTRGNMFGLNHTTLNTDSSEFWNFTFQDMKHDVAANIKKILKVTNKKRLNYLAWSQGTAAMFVAGQSQEYSAYIHQTVKHFIALSPIAHIAHQTSSLINLMVDFHLDLLRVIFRKRFLNGVTGVHTLENIICKLTWGAVCSIATDLFCGTSDLDEAKNIERFVMHFPSGTSVKDLLHFEQLAVKDRFGKYDYGEIGNQAHYGQSSPPNFDLSKFKVPTALFFASKDDLVNKKDADTLVAELPNGTITNNLVFDNYSHLSWLVGKPETEAWIDQAIEITFKHQNDVKSKTQKRQSEVRGVSSKRQNDFINIVDKHHNDVEKISLMKRKVSLQG